MIKKLDLEQLGMVLGGNDYCIFDDGEILVCLFIDGDIYLSLFNSLSEASTIFPDIGSFTPLGVTPSLLERRKRLEHKRSHEYVF